MPPVQSQSNEPYQQNVHQVLGMSGQSGNTSAPWQQDTPPTLTGINLGNINSINSTTRKREPNEHSLAQPGQPNQSIERITGEPIAHADQHGGADLGLGSLNLATTANALLNGAMRSAIEIQGLKTALKVLQSQPQAGVLIGLTQARIVQIRDQYALSLAPQEAFLESLSHRSEQYAHVGGKDDQAFLESFSNHFTSNPQKAQTLANKTLFFPGSSDGIAAVLRFIKARHTQSQSHNTALPKLAPSFTTSYGGYPEAAQGLGFKQIRELSERTQSDYPVIMPIVNPNNPLGEYETPESLIQQFINPLPKGSVVIIDESGLDWIEGERQKSFFNPDYLPALETAQDKGISVFVIKSLTKITNSLGDPRGGIVTCLNEKTAQDFKKEQCPQYHSPAALAFYKAFYDHYEDIATKTQQICTAHNAALRQQISETIQKVNQEHGGQIALAFSGVESMPYLCVKLGALPKESAPAPLTAQTQFQTISGNTDLAETVFKQCETDKISIRNLSNSYYNKNESGPYNAKGTMNGVIRVRVCSAEDAKAFCQSLSKGLIQALTKG